MESGIRNPTYRCCPGLNMDVSQPLSHCLSPSHPLFSFLPIFCEVLETLLHLGFFRERIFGRDIKRVHWFRIHWFIKRVYHGECLFSCVNFHVVFVLITVSGALKWDLHEFILFMNVYICDTFISQISNVYLHVSTFYISNFLLQNFMFISISEYFYIPQ